MKPKSLGSILLLSAITGAAIMLFCLGLFWGVIFAFDFIGPQITISAIIWLMTSVIAYFVYKGVL